MPKKSGKEAQKKVLKESVPRELLVLQINKISALMITKNIKSNSSKNLFQKYISAVVKF